MTCQGNSIYTVLSILLLFPSTVLCAESSPKPHIIYILADDLGWDDVSFHGSDQILTPNLDALAYNGVMLNNYYVQQICTPSRAALMTGKYIFHTGMQHGVIMASEPFGLGLNETIMPQYLKQLGYATHIVGKWHLGFFHKEYTPTFRGFDSHYGYWTGREDYYTKIEKEDYSGFDFRHNMDIDNSTHGKYSTELYASEALKIIQDHDSSKPLFLYLPFQAVHDPYEAPIEYTNRFPNIENKGRRTFAGMLAALDDAIGQIVIRLHEKNMLENSVIMFSADNGGPAASVGRASNFPLRGMKYSMWEGGVRGTGFIYSSLLKKRQRQSNQMMHITDWLPTILHAAGYNMSNLTGLDGIDMWDALSNDMPSPRQEIFHNIDPYEGFAVRVGDYKMLTFKCCDWGHAFNDWYQTPQAEDGWIQDMSAKMHHVSEQEQLKNYHREDERLNKKSEMLQISHNIVKDKSFLMQKKNISRIINRSERKNTDQISASWDVYYLTKQARSSSVHHILKAPKNITYSRIVQCGPIPANASSNCNVNKEVCLYNIHEDPCEYYNLAKEKPEILKKLMDRLKVVNATAVQPRNKPSTKEANPALHGGVWTNYADKK